MEHGEPMAGGHGVRRTRGRRSGARRGRGAPAGARVRLRGQGELMVMGARRACGGRVCRWGRVRRRDGLVRRVGGRPMKFIPIGRS